MFYPKDDDFEFDLTDDDAYLNPPEKEDDFNAPVQSKTIDSRPLQSGDIITVGGYSVLIENPAGSVRKWIDQTGRSGESVMTCHYGELQGYTGADDDFLDVFIVG